LAWGFNVLGILFAGKNLYQLLSEGCCTDECGMNGFVDRSAQWRTTGIVRRSLVVLAQKS